MTESPRKELIMEGWHLDKRVSISHIITTFGIAGMLMVLFFGLEERVKVNEVRIEALQATNVTMRVEIRAMGENIVAKLDAMGAQSYQHLERHLEEAGEPGR